MKIPELLAPAGNMEKAKVAIEYGADALYMAGKAYGMRASAVNFDLDELHEIIDYGHKRGVRIYVTVNIFPHNQDLEGLPEYLGALDQLKVDALILADVGVYRLAKLHAPNTPLHLSTQANTTNYQSALFWQELGMERLVMAREISKQDIALIRQKTSVELEVFVHGAMCMAYSGRCLLSHVLTGRDANRGACAQSCRWKYTVMEENRPGEYFPVVDEEEGSYIFNSKDLCLIEFIPDLVEIGVDSLKIEGRMKSAYYVATVVRAYREALDAYARDPKNYRLNPELLTELAKVSHRPYYTGFFLGQEAGTHLESSKYEQSHQFVGVVDSYDLERKQATVTARNRFTVGSEIEIMQPRGDNLTMHLTDIIQDNTDQQLQEAHANYVVRIPLETEVKPWSMLRVKKEKQTRGSD